MRSLPEGLALVIPAQEIGGGREPFKVFGFERRVTIGGLQQPIRFGPRLSREEFTAMLERPRLGHVPSTQW